MVLILDDYDKNNILNLTGYTSGVQLVRNLIIFDSNTSTDGSFTFYVEPYATSFSFAIFVGSTGYMFPNNTTLKGLVIAVHATTALREDGIDMELLQDITLEGTEYAEVVRITCDYLTDYKTIACEVNEGTGYTFAGQSVRYSQTGGDFYRTYFTLLPDGDNSGILARDYTSILNYGSKIYSLENYEMLTSPDEKQATLDNKLAELKDPKARCYLDIPFDYTETSQVTLLDEVEVRLQLQNVGQFGRFKEGGHYKSWDEGEIYRYKSFYIIGIDHAQDGTTTRLRLIEKIKEV